MKIQFFQNNKMHWIYSQVELWGGARRTLILPQVSGDIFNDFEVEYSCKRKVSLSNTIQRTASVNAYAVTRNNAKIPLIAISNIMIEDIGEVEKYSRGVAFTSSGIEDFSKKLKTVLKKYCIDKGNYTYNDTADKNPASMFSELWGNIGLDYLQGNIENIADL